MQKGVVIRGIAIFGNPRGGARRLKILELSSRYPIHGPRFARLDSTRLQCFFERSYSEVCKL